MIAGNELADELGVTPQALSKAAKKGHRCAGHPVAEWAVRDGRGWVEGYQPPPGVIGGDVAAAAAADDSSRVNPVDQPERGVIHMSPGVRELVERNRRRRAAEADKPVDPEAPADQVAETEATSEAGAEEPESTNTAWVLGGLALAIGLPWIIGRLESKTATGVGVVPLRSAVNSPLGNSSDGAPAHQLGESAPIRRARLLEQPRPIVGIQLPPALFQRLGGRPAVSPVRV